MITNRMSYEEILEEIKKDFPNQREFIKKLSYQFDKTFNRKTQMQSRIKGLRKRGIYNINVDLIPLMHYKFKSARGNQYYALHLVRLDAEYGETRIFAVLPPKTSSGIGEYAKLNLDPMTGYIGIGYIITSHYIDRIRQRCEKLKNISSDLDDILTDAPNNSEIIDYFSSQISADREIKVSNTLGLRRGLCIFDPSQFKDRETLIPTLKLGYVGIDIISPENIPGCIFIYRTYIQEPRKRQKAQLKEYREIKETSKEEKQYKYVKENYKMYDFLIERKRLMEENGD